MGKLDYITGWGINSRKDTPKLVKILENENRRSIVNIVQENPRINWSELKEMSGLNNGVLAYHLSVLEKAGIISSEKINYEIHYFIANTGSLKQIA